MLFVFDSSERFAFTMADTLIPLDIGFYDESGEFVEALQMVPCPADESDCPRYKPDEPFVLALEVPAGVLAEGGLQVVRPAGQ